MSLVSSIQNATLVAVAHLKQVQQIATTIQTARAQGVPAQRRYITDPVTRRPVVVNGVQQTEEVTSAITAVEYEAALGGIGSNLTAALGVLNTTPEKLAAIQAILAAE